MLYLVSQFVLAVRQATILKTALKQKIPLDLPKRIELWCYIFNQYIAMSSDKSVWDRRYILMRSSWYKDTQIICEMKKSI